MDFMNSFNFSNILSPFIISASTAYLFLKYLGKRTIEQLYLKDMERFRNEQNTYSYLLRNLKDNQVDAAKKLPQQISEVRNLCRDIIEFNDYSDEKHNVLNTSIQILQSTLYEYKLVLSTDTYNKIHFFKELGRDFRGKLKNISSGPLKDKNDLKILNKKFNKINEMRDEIFQNEILFKNNDLLIAPFQDKEK